jgi:K+-sensing histidine kinase KdpD
VLPQRLIISEWYNWAVARSRGPFEPTRDRLSLLAALAAPFAVCAGLALIRGSLPNTDAALLLVLVVVAVAGNGYRLAGVLAALSAAVWFDFFLTQPYERFTIDRTSDAKTTVLLLAVGVSVTELAVWGRRKAALALRQEGYLTGIRVASEASASGGSGSTLVSEVSQQLTRVLGLVACRFEQGVAGVGQPARLRHDGEVEWGHAVWDVARQGLPVDVEIEIVVENHGRLIGRYMMRAARASHPTRSQRLVAVTLADQVGSALG